MKDISHRPERELLSRQTSESLMAPRQGPSLGRAREQVERLPNGLEVECLQRAELEHFYSDIFTDQVYLRHAIELPVAPCVFDVGANIGLFTIFIRSIRPEAQIYAFEPAPPIFPLLQRNVARHAPGARLFNIGLADRRGTAELTFYPNSTGMSSFAASYKEERELLSLLLDNEARGGSQAAQEMLPHREDYLERRLKRETYRCRLATLSGIIAREGIEHIDLLKIDVQKSELQILIGLVDDDWAKISQMAIEVHDIDNRVVRLQRLLEMHHFATHIEQEELYRGSDLFLLYATSRRERIPATDKTGGFQDGRVTA